MSVEPGLSFGREVEAYERARPPYAPDALAWLGERLSLRDVLDLGAGTGKLTRQLAGAGATVIAVEPDPSMRAMLERVLPDVDARQGAAEAIPLPDACVDAITVAQAFHWFDRDAALAEMHRVLRPGGGIALVWNEYTWPALEPILGPLVRPRDGDAERDRLFSTPHFTNFEERSFRHSDRVDAETIVDRMSSISAVIGADAAVRERVFADLRALAGTGIIDFPMTTVVIAADRV